MKRKVADEIKLSVGDLVGVCWGDASVGKGLGCGTRVDILVQSFGWKEIWKCGRKRTSR